jgi:hypothetical protein
MIRPPSGGSSHRVKHAGERAPFWKLVCIRALFFPLLFAMISPILRYRWFRLVGLGLTK